MLQEKKELRESVYTFSHQFMQKSYKLSNFLSVFGYKFLIIGLFREPSLSFEAIMLFILIPHSSSHAKCAY